MKKFNLRIFMIATVVTVLLCFVSWVGLEAHNTPDKAHTLLGMVGGIWTILRFPIFTFFWKFLYGQNNFLLFVSAVYINCAFYGVMVERIIYFLRKEPKIPPAPAGI